MGVRREARELALQALYALDLNPLDAREALLAFWEERRASAAVREFADDLVIGVWDHRREIDALIDSQSSNWSIARMARVDLNLLRLGTYELLYRPDIPKNVTINEAIEVAKKFGSEESPAFVNGILDEISGKLPEKRHE